MWGLFKNKLSRTVVILAAVLVVLMGITVYRDNKSLVESGAGAALNPVQKVLYSVNKRVESFIDFFLRYEDVKAENTKLILENLELEDKLRAYETMRQENEQLRAMFDIKDRRTEYDYLGVNIIGSSGGGILTSYTIDRGSDAGIKAGMAVMTPAGIVGQVTEVASTWALVETLSSENVSIHVTTVENKANSGILRGHTGAGQAQQAKITYLPLDADIAPGNQVVTSGLGGFYPPDIFVGKVIKILEDKGELMKTAIIEPAAGFKSAQQLFVIIPKNSEEVQY